MLAARANGMDFEWQMCIMEIWDISTVIVEKWPDIPALKGE